MPSTDTQRPKKQPPFINLGTIREMRGLKQKDLCQKVRFISGQALTQGALAAIENGTRGVSADTLRALEIALELKPEALQTLYVPEHSRRRVAS